MNGIDILRHGLDMLLRNIGPALRLSLGPFVLLFLVTMVLGALGLGFGYGIATGGAGVSDATVAGAVAGGILGGLLWLVLYLVTFAWVAVAWHRFILLEELPSGLLPAFRSDLVWPYLGRSILLALVLIGVSIPMSLIVFPLIGSGSVAASVAAVTVMSLVLGWVGTRLSLVLPACAVERPLGMRDSWAATAPASGAILLAVFLLALVNGILGLLLGQIPGIVGGLLSLALQWFLTMLGLSVLTTLYGSLVERRQLAV